MGRRYTEEKQVVKEIVMEKISFDEEIEDDRMQELIDQTILFRDKDNGLSLEEKKRLGKELFNEFRKLDILQELLEDETISEIMINGCNSIFIEKEGAISPWQGCFDRKETLDDVIQRIVAQCNRVVNEQTPIVDARLSDGARVHIIMAPVAINGPIVTIRKFTKEPMKLETLVSKQALSAEMAETLRDLVRKGCNMLISGGTGSGKTTFLNALASCVSPTERIITIEDSAELMISGIPNLVRLETRNANVEGCTQITIRDLIRASLRMRPDRIIVGEVRGVETVDMIQALNTGHEGSLSTVHANSAKDTISRLETMMLMGIDLPLTAIRRQIAAGIDIIIHLGRMSDKSRKVLEIVEVGEVDREQINLKCLYQYESEGSKWIQKGKVSH